MHHHHVEKSPECLPTQGPSLRPLPDHRLKVKSRRQERRKLRAAIRSWFEGNEFEAT